MYPILYSNAFLMLLGASLWGHGSSDTRVVSGKCCMQTLDQETLYGGVGAMT